MAANDFGIDPQLLNEFLDESVDALAPLESLFLRLRVEPGNVDLVNQIFRPVHSLKGNAAFFGMLRTKELSHKMENLLDLYRQGGKKPDEAGAQSLLKGLDLLRSFIGRARTGEAEVDDEELYKKTLDAVVAAAEVAPIGIDAAAAALLAEAMDTLKGMLADIPEELQPTLDALVRKIAAQIPGAAGGAGGGKDAPAPLRTIIEILAEPFADELEEGKSRQIFEALESLRESADDPSTIGILDAAIDEYNTFVGQIGFDPLLRELILEKAEVLADKGVWPAAESTAEPAPLEEGAAAESAAATGKKASVGRGGGAAAGEQADKTMRVSERRIDEFLSYVGELVVVEEMFSFIHRRLEASANERALAQDFKRILETFDALADNLRRSILSIRMVPIGNLLQKSPRIIHDIASQTGKQVEVVIQGDKINVDKSYLELLDAPLTHMLRNAIDHGVETPERRRAVGKPEKGTIKLTVVESEGDLVITLVDDGQGINLEKIRAKAVDMGLIAEGQALDNDRLTQLLFESGVSTAEQITDVSGRGVGMDVARRNIQAAGGRIDISTTPDKGTSFTLTMPQNISTQIMQGFLVKVLDEIYVLPMGQVRESFAPRAGDVSSVTNKGEIVSRHGLLHPVVRMRQFLGFERDGFSHGAPPEILVTVEVNGRLYALAVDQIVGVQKVVVKPVAEVIIDSRLFDGAALMGDGTVAMVLNTERVDQVLSARKVKVKARD